MKLLWPEAFSRFRPPSLCALCLPEGRCTKSFCFGRLASFHCGHLTTTEFLVRRARVWMHPYSCASRARRARIGMHPCSCASRARRVNPRRQKGIPKHLCNSCKGRTEFRDMSLDFTFDIFTSRRAPSKALVQPASQNMFRTSKFITSEFRILIFVIL